MEKHLNNLTGLRFGAALLILGHHSSWSGSSKVVETFFSAGYVGVSFFFVLSGFVIAYAYQTRLDGEITKKEYLLLRLARIWPMHFLTAVPYLVVAILNSNLNIFEGILNLALIQSFLPFKSVYFSLNAVSWSLSNEIFFYLCFIPLFKLSNKRLITFWAIFLALLLLIASYVHYQNTYMNNESFLLSNWLFYIFPPFRLIEFLSGILLYRFYVKGVIVSSIFLPFAYFFLVIAMLISPQVSEPFRYSLFFLPFIIFLLSAHLNNKSFLDNFLSSKLMRVLGEASFSFYLIHNLSLIILRKVLPDLSDLLNFLLSGFIIMIASVMIFNLVERKIHKKLKALIMSRQ